ncbi:MAG: hypothetical protein LBM98_00500 [Oscillospiraceae bacterium]|nr:hypothetical protein [Oscillospiraceae bacterium]
MALAKTAHGAGTPPPTAEAPPTKEGGVGGQDGGYVRARRGIPPRRYAAPLPRGEFTGEGGFETRPYVYCTSRNPRPNPFPSWEGCRPQAAGWFPPQGATPVLTLRL